MIQFMVDNVKSMERDENGDWNIIAYSDNRDCGGGPHDEDVYILNGSRKCEFDGLYYTFGDVGSGKEEYLVYLDRTKEV